MRGEVDGGDECRFTVGEEQPRRKHIKEHRRTGVRSEFGCRHGAFVETDPALHTFLWMAPESSINRRSRKKTCRLSGDNLSHAVRYSDSDSDSDSDSPRSTAILETPATRVRWTSANNDRGCIYLKAYPYRCSSAAGSFPVPPGPVESFDRERAWPCASRGRLAFLSGGLRIGHDVNVADGVGRDGSLQQPEEEQSALVCGRRLNRKTNSSR